LFLLNSAFYCCSCEFAWEDISVAAEAVGRADDVFLAAVARADVIRAAWSWLVRGRS